MKLRLLRPVRSSLGGKYIMALTGLALIGFVVAHMSGNLLIYAGRDALNSYAAALKDRPALLWPARLGLLAVFVIHIVLGIRLTRQNSSARPVRYIYEDTLQASWASRHMLLTGLVLLAFTIYHLAHFTFGVIVPAEPPGDVPQREVEELPRPDRGPQAGEDVEGHAPDRSVEAAQGWDVRQDVYSMVVSGFRNPGSPCPTWWRWSSSACTCGTAARAGSSRWGSTIRATTRLSGRRSGPRCDSLSSATARSPCPCTWRIVK